jgi:hypothetical protein
MSRSFRAVAALGLIVASGGYFDGAARGQGAVAFQPSIGFIPNGSTLTVTPAVSADRRYVRLSVNPFFNTINGFTTYTSQLGAVGGTGFGGMNGVNVGGGAGVGQGGPTGSGSPLFTGYGLAGPLPPPGTSSGDPFMSSGAAGFGGAAGAGIAFGANPGIGGQAAAQGPWPWEPPAFSEAEDGGAVRTARPARSHRPAARKAARRPTTTARRRPGTAPASPRP